MQRICEFPGVFEHICQWTEKASTDFVYRDAYDGSILRGLDDEVPIFHDASKRKRLIPFSMCTDATTVGQNTKPISMTPVVAICLALPEYLRERFTLMYLVACFPKRAKDPIFLTPIAEMFQKYGPHGEGITIRGLRFYIVKAWRVDDLGGIAGGINAKQHGSYVGSCLQCKIRGVHCFSQNGDRGTIYYPGAVTFLPNTPEGRDIRRKFKETFKEFKGML